MADELASECARLNLNEKEDITVPLDEEEDEVAQPKHDHYRLVGKLLTNRPFSKNAMKNTLLKIWKPLNGLAVRELESNLFIFQFFSATDKYKVVEGIPWTFDNNLLLLKEFEENVRPSEISFDESPMWIKIYDTPIGKRNRKTAKILGNHIGKYLDYDDSDELNLNRTLNIKVLIELKKPLMRGIYMNVGGVSKWCPIKYVRLPTFCYYCGIMGHQEKECHIREEEGHNDDRIANQFGGWLKASPLKGGSRLNDKEREQEKI